MFHYHLGTIKIFIRARPKNFYVNVNKQLQLPFSCFRSVKKKDVVIIVLHVFVFEGVK